MHKEGKKEEKEEKGGRIGKGEEFVRGTKRNNLLSSRPKKKDRWKKGFNLDQGKYLVNVPPPELS